MTDTVIVTGAAPEGAAEVAPLAEGAVEIAQIEAERDVTIATIQAEVTETAIEAGSEEDEAWLRSELDSLRQGQEELRGNLSNQALALETMAQQMAELTGMVTTSLTPPPPLEPEAEPLAPTTPLEPEAVLENTEEGGPRDAPAPRAPARGARRLAWL